jgi:hypothetical protein
MASLFLPAFRQAFNSGAPKSVPRAVFGKKNHGYVNCFTKDFASLA